MWRVKGDGLKGCGLGRATVGGGFNKGAAVLACFGWGWPGDGNGCVDNPTTEPFFSCDVLTLDGLSSAAIGAVLDIGVEVVVPVDSEVEMMVGAWAGVVVFPSEGCCGDGFDTLVPFTSGVVVAAVGVTAPVEDCCCEMMRQNNVSTVVTLKALIN